MSEKVYSIASPSICIKEKSHVVLVGSGPNRNEKVYSFSVSPAKRENKNQVDYPICIAPYARYKAIKEDHVGVTATKVRAKGVFTGAIEEALRQIEVDAYISNTTDFELNRNINVANIEMQHSRRADEVSVQLITAEDSTQHGRIFDINHIEGVESTRQNEKVAISNNLDTADRITQEHESSSIAEQELVKMKLREFVADSEELPEWVRIARIVYGEGFYEEITGHRISEEVQVITINETPSTIVTREFESKFEEITLPNAVTEMKLATIIENESSEIQRDDILVHSQNELDIANKEKELQAVMEESELFDGMGLPVYLPDFDLFARIQKELLVNIAAQNEVNLIKEIHDTHVINYENTIVVKDISAACTELDHAVVEKVIPTLHVHSDDFTRMKEIDASMVIDAETDKKIHVINSHKIECETYERVVDQDAVIKETEEADRVVEVLESVYFDKEEAQLQREYNGSITICDEGDNTSRVLSVESLIKMDETERTTDMINSHLIETTVTTRDKNINSVVEKSDLFERSTTESQIELIDFVSAEDSKEVLTHVIEFDISDKAHAEQIAHLVNDLVSESNNRTIIAHTDMNEAAEKPIKEYNSLLVEFELLEGLGVPVYLPDFDLFGIVHKEFETRIAILEMTERQNQMKESQILSIENTQKVIREVQTENTQMIGSERVTQEFHAAAVDVITTDKVILDVETNVIKSDDFTTCRTQQIIIDKTTSFNGIRELDGGVITEISSSDKSNIIKDIHLLEDTQAIRESLHNTTLSNQDLFDRINQIEAIHTTYNVFDRVNTLQTIMGESERSKRITERPSVMGDYYTFLLERVLDTEKPDEVIEIQKENDDPKLWLRHSRQSWWTNSNWKKTR
ncbi:hypothetical protein [Bacillus mobilis]|uniref:hypothetical protein n=1 Tax=Bacillus mobilis TaxID=2026190 RepID=UPI000A30211E|nr:hypothetical protein [Bacillus mobilis]MCU5595618.1 hypothetical protein [Bacillus mobilis]MCU5738540.1 hypothetical protein [Bacillus mobilis]MCU9559532.1 hypothetical protein [Bacillus mobilis]SME28686.1 hypothetical protein BACERE00177_03550 [Bacillus mobilis]HDR7517055.1 hypothetical protein [Bacillus mobilis]